MADEQIIVQLAGPERKYVRTYHDFLDNSLLTSEEQMIFIVLKSYIDFSSDEGDVFPGMKTICKRSKLSEPRARRTINSLIKKGIIKKVRRGLTKTNLYTLADYPKMWTCSNVEEMAAIIDHGGVKPLTPGEHIAELEKMGYIVEIKEKGLASGTAKDQTQVIQKNQFSNQDDTTVKGKSQVERYNMENIRILYNYNDLILRYPEKQTDINVIFDILYDTLNTAKQFIRIAGEDKPVMTVISKLMRLDPDDLIYSIDKYHGQTKRIQNVTGYLLTILYNAREQRQLDIENLGHHNGDF